MGDFHKCEQCSRLVHKNKVVWLELSNTDGRYYEELPEGHVSQGGFPFGKDCAQVVLKQAPESKIYATNDGHYYKEIGDGRAVHVNTRSKLINILTAESYSDVKKAYRLFDIGFEEFYNITKPALDEITKFIFEL